jgi:hypothetical protein
MRFRVTGLFLAALFSLASEVYAQAPRTASLRTGSSAAGASAAEDAALGVVEARFQADLETVQTFRPAYSFWRHIFTIPDGRVAVGSARDGRLLAVFPVRGDWVKDATWEDASLRDALSGHTLPRTLSARRDAMVRLLTPAAGPLVHNPTRGQFLLPNASRYGSFLEEWGTIYARFGVPPEIGLSQAVLESGLNGRARSRARALGFCQWLSRNWDHLNRLTPHQIEAFNQTTQAPYCAAYLSILATMYGSFIPALSEHHSGGVNVGRVVINGERLGGNDAREQYFMGAAFARELRSASLMRYRDLYRTYGPRSFLYAEMVFGNTITVRRIADSTPQARIYAMRTSRALPLTEIVRATGLPQDEVLRFNPAIVRAVPARADLYLPSYVETFGPDVSFWHRPARPEYAEVLNDFVRIDAGVKAWHEPEFETVLRRYQRRFEETGSEEGSVMATTLAYVIDDLRTSRRAAILEEFRTSGRILQLFSQGLREIQASLPGS